MAAFTAILTLSALATLIGVMQLDRLDLTLHHITQETVPYLVRTEKMLADTYVMEVETRNLVAARDLERAQEAVASYNQAHQALMNDLHWLYNEHANDEHSLSLIALDTGLNNYQFLYEAFRKEALAYQQLKVSEPPLVLVQVHDGLVTQLTEQHGPAIDELQQHLIQFMTDMSQALEEDELVSADRFFSVQASMLLLLAVAIVIGLSIARLVSRSINRSLQLAQRQASQVVAGNLQEAALYSGRDEVGALIEDLNHMTGVLRRLQEENEQRTWVDQNLARLHETAQGEKGLEELSRQILVTLCECIRAQLGTLYLRKDTDEAGYPWIQPELHLQATYALDKEQVPSRFRWGEGLTGQAAKDGRWLQVEEVPSHYFTAASGLGKASTLSLLVAPFWFGQDVRGVIEVASLHPWSTLELELLERGLKVTGVAIQAAFNREELIRSLKDSQAFTEELQVQQEELQATNEELATQSQALEESQLELAERNLRLEQAQSALNTRAQQLQQASQYKSEFLANMSHELRTPLNSILLLSRMMAGDLQEVEVQQHAEVIREAGEELLLMIDDLLDLSRIEAGKMPIALNRVDLREFVESFHGLFQPQAQEQGLRFRIEADDQVPEWIESDQTRLQQVIRNFLSNAFKFTKWGEVTLRVEPVSEAVIENLATYGSLKTHLREEAEAYVVFSVSDTGVGIPGNKFQLVFEAFRQVDGSISREYGGTGLGLAISAQIAHLLEGALALQSSTASDGHGSIFSLVVPVRPSEALLQVADSSDLRFPSWEEASPARGNTVQLEDDRHRVTNPEARTLLVVEDDPLVAPLVLQLGRELGYQVLHASSGIEGLRLAEQYLPKLIVLSAEAALMNGWSVLRQLKQQDATSHIPVVLLSQEDEEALGLRLGAFTFLRKPVPVEELRQVLKRAEERQQRSLKRLLIVEDRELERQAIQELLECGTELECEAVTRGADAIEALRSNRFDTCILDLSLPDLSGFEVLQQVRQDPAIERVPIIVYTSQSLTLEEERDLREMAQSIILKTADSPARLLEETTLFLHRNRGQLSTGRQELLQALQEAEPAFAGKTVLLADDDIRSAYALASLLKRKGLQVLTAADGTEALDLADQHREQINLILMDVMMPGLDGLEVIRRLRAQKRFATLPILALTAKAMKGDRDGCLAVGASDYLTKPIDEDQLLSLLRLWLSPQRTHER